MTDEHRASGQSFALPWMNLFQGPQFWTGFGTCAKAAEPVARSAAAAQMQAMSLVGYRARAWAEIPETLSHCRTPADLFQAQVAFWQEAGRNYTEAAEHAMSSWRGLLPGSFSATGDPVAPRDYITFPEANADAEAEDRRHPGAARRAA